MVHCFIEFSTGLYAIGRLIVIDKNIDFAWIKNNSERKILENGINYLGFYKIKNPDKYVIPVLFPVSNILEKFFLLRNNMETFLISLSSFEHN